MPKQARQVSAADFLPPPDRKDGRISLRQMSQAVQGCRGCDLYEHATQAVFGEGPGSARVMMVGEQPGDREDTAGKPFVGPSGRVLDHALAEAGIDRGLVYVTNAVKHFRFEARGRARLHAKPAARHVRACKPWLEHEIETIHPSVIVCLGATAAQALLGSAFRITKQRGDVIEGTPWAPAVLATVHPSSILRQPDEEMRRLAYIGFVDDLRIAREAMDRAA